MEITEAQQQAIRRLYAGGSTGVIDRYGRLVVAGEALAKVAPETWLRLVTYGYVEANGPNRLNLTKQGERVARS